MIFDVKMDGKLIRKARFVADDHLTEPPANITYSSTVSWESIRITFLLASILGLEVLSADLGNAYINTPCQEKIWCEAGFELGSNLDSTVLIIERALYRLKRSAASWRNMLPQTMIEMGFNFCIADNDFWMRESVKKGGTEGRWYRI